jgi:hypothetical protein
MAFFDDITSSATEIYNSGVEFVGDAVSSVSNTVSNGLDYIAGDIPEASERSKTKGVMQYPLTLGATTPVEYESDPDILTMATSKSTGDPFVTFAFKEISISEADLGAINTVSGDLSKAGIAAATSYGVMKMATSGGGSGSNLVNAAKAVAVVSAGAAAIYSVSKLEEAFDSMAANAKLDQNPNRITRSHVALYMPSGITIQDGANYEANSRAAIALATEGYTNEDIKVATAAMAGQALMGSGVGAAALGATGAPTGGVIAAAGELIHLTGDEDLRILGRAMNPNEYMQFKSTQLRTFSMSFKFLPESNKESAEVTDIIKEFRTALYPTKNSAITLVVPDILDISFHGAEGMVKMPEVALTSVNVTYNPNSASFFKQGGTPVELSMSIEMQEIHPIHRDDVINGGL